MNRTDPEIRAALLPQIRASHPDALIVQEWAPVDRGLVVDVAAIGADSIDAWEIKSDADSTARLAKQAPLYSALFDRCAIVSAPRHLARVREIVPAWWGVLVATDAEIWTEREGQANPAPPNQTAMLWAPELRVIADRFDVRASAFKIHKEEYCQWYPSHFYRRPRNPHRRNVEAALGAVPQSEIAPLIRSALRARSNWRREDGYRAARETP